MHSPVRAFTVLLVALLAAAPRPTSAAEEASWNWAPDRSYDLRHVELHLDLDPHSDEIRGRVFLELASLVDGLERLEFQLVDLSVDEVLDGSGRALEHRHRGGVVEIWPAEPLGFDETATVEIAWSGVPTKGLYWVRPSREYPGKPWQIWSQSEMEDARHWWPTWDYPNDRATSEVHVTTPRPFEAVSNGELVEVRERGEDRTFVWRMEVPHVTYLTSVAVGDWEEAREEWEGISLHYYVPPGREKDIPRSFSDTADMMGWFSELTGRRYPYPRYNQTAVTDFIYGGMENIAATTLTDSTLHDERAHQDYPSTGLVAHELAHQWFGDLITCESWAHTWLNEGFATYFAALYVGRKEGPDQFLLEIEGLRRDSVGADAGSGRRPVVVHRWRDPFDMFDGHAYDKGAMVLHMLRDLLGDEAFFRALRAYVERHAGTVVDSDDFQDAVESATGKSLEWFFRQWIHRAGHPELHAAWSWEEAIAEAEGDAGGEGGGEGAGRVRVELEQLQERPEGEPRFRFPLLLRVHLEPGRWEDHRIEMDEERKSVVLPVDARPEAVVVDPESALLATIEEDRPREEIVWLLQHGASPIVRLRAATALAEEGPRAKVAPALVGALREDPFYRVRAEAASSLGKIGGAEARRALRDALEREEDSRTRRAVAAALGHTDGEGDEEAALRRALTTDDSYAVRASAARALGELAGEDAWPTLRRALRQDSHREVVRGAVFDAISSAPIPQALPEARRWSRAGPPSRARTAAIGAVAALGWELDLPERRPLLEELEEILAADPNLFVRSAAARGLGELGHPAAYEALRRAAASDPQARVRRSARSALDRLDARRAEVEGRGELLRRMRELEDETRDLGRQLDELEERVAPRESGAEERKAMP